MSTERKPGSRGVRDPFSQAAARRMPTAGGQSGGQERERKKGSTKTASPRKGFKKKRGK